MMVKINNNDMYASGRRPEALLLCTYTGLKYIQINEKSKNRHKINSDYLLYSHKLASHNQLQNENIVGMLVIDGMEASRYLRINRIESLKLTSL